MITTTVLSPAVDKVYFLDHFSPGKLFRAKELVTSPGGKGINVARVSKTLGNPVTALGFKAGKTGEWLEAKLIELGVHTEFIQVSGESRTNINIIDRVQETETEVLEIGPLVSEAEQTVFMECFERALVKTDVLVCSGGLPEGIPSNFYERLIRLARKHDIKTILDSNGPMLETGVEAGPYLVKPNLRELSKYAGKPLTETKDIQKTCRQMIAKGVEMVVASMGKEGALLVTKDLSIFAKAPEIKVVNTIGSGDSMVAGLATGIQRGLSKEETLKLGMACALANTQYREIGVISLPWVDTFLEKIEIKIEA